MENNNYIYDSEQPSETYDNNGIKDCFNPFGNNTEFKDYNSDYRKIAPQIAIKNYKLPDIPEKSEKKNIRYYFNIVGAFMLFQLIAVNILIIVLNTIVTIAISSIDGSQSISEVYAQTILTKFNTSSINMAIIGLCYTIINIFIFMIGCKVTKINKSSLFQTTNLNWQTMCRYIIIAIFLQRFSIRLSSILYQLFNITFGIDINTTATNIQMTSSITKIITIILYSCIIAPILEELVMRGFVLKNLSRVSQRFGIITSSLMFAFIHDNIPQFILAFIVGIFLGYITVKHNSLLPAIALHIILNSTNIILSLISEFNSSAGIIISIYEAIFLIVGMIVFILSIALQKDKLPKPVQAQKNRGVPVLFTSVSMVSFIAIHIILICLYI